MTIVSKNLTLVFRAFVVGTGVASACIVSIRWANAEIYKCNGVISDRPCEQVAAAPTRTKEQTDKAVARSKKDLLLHDLRTKVFNARRASDVSVDLSSAEEVCRPESTTLTQCRDEVQKLESVLADRVARAEFVEAARKRGAKEPTTPTQPGVESNQVVIIQNTEIERRRYDPYDRRDRHDRNNSDHGHGRHPTLGNTPASIPNRGLGNFQYNPEQKTPPKSACQGTR